MKFTALEKEQIEFFLNKFNFCDDLKNKTVLITGSKGIVGTALIKWVCFLNEIYDCNCKIIASTRNPLKIPDYIEKQDLISFCSFGEEIEFCKNIKLDIIISCASPTDNNYFVEKPIETIDTIVQGTRSLLNLAKEKKANMIFLSSEEVYGSVISNESISENFVGSIDSLNLRSSYPLSKKIAELMCFSSHKEYGVNVRIIRPTLIIGLWQDYNNKKIESEILRCLCEDRNIILKTDGSSKKSIIFTLDVISAIFTVLFKGKPGCAYNATNESTFCSVLDRCYDLISFLKKENTVKVEFNSTETNKYLKQRCVLENTQALRDLGWEPLFDAHKIFQLEFNRFNKK